VKKYLIDTNALISYVTDRNPVQQQVVAPLFHAASRYKCTLICHQFVLTEFIFVMEKVYIVPKETITDMVRAFLALPGVELRHETDFSAIFSLWPSAIADFGDALLTAVAQATPGAVVLTFDAKFTTALKRLSLPVYQM
jgi:predicted nucleic-acid-binding protein